jgi:hypothetical protein
MQPSLSLLKISRACFMSMYMLLGLDRAASIQKCNIDMGMQHGHGHSACTVLGYAAWTWICSMDMDMQYVLGHAEWAWTCGMDMDMQNGHWHAE